MSNLSSAQLGLVLRECSSENVRILAADAESAGLSCLLFPEGGHVGEAKIEARDPFVLSSVALDATNTLHVGTGVAASVIRPVYQAAISAASLQDASGGRFLLGCGVSHASYSEGSPTSYPASPLTHIDGYVRELKTFSRDRLTYGRSFPVYVAALGPKMLQRAAAVADGVILNWLTPSATSSTVSDWKSSMSSTEASVKHSVLYVRVGPLDALRHKAARYGSTMPNYTRHFTRQGLGDADDVVRQTCLYGSLADIVARLNEYEDTGIDTLCLYPVGLSPRSISDLLARLADNGR